MVRTGPRIVDHIDISFLQCYIENANEISSTHETEEKFNTWQTATGQLLSID